MTSVPDGAVRHVNEREDKEIHRYVQALLWRAVVAESTVM